MARVERQMVMLLPCVEFVVKEHALRPIGPDVLFIPRQTVPMSLDVLNGLLERYGLKNQAPDEVEYDTEVPGAGDCQFVSIRYLLKALGVEHFHTLDVTECEGADVVLDLGKPLPNEFYARYDFIFNGGCLDNIFNPGVAMINISKMLKARGRSINVEHASSFNTPYLMYSPGWFYDFYVVNKYMRAQIYLVSVNNSVQHVYGPWDVEYVNLRADRNGPSPKPSQDIHYILLTVAEKGGSSTDEVQPVQWQYRANPELQHAYEQNEADLTRNSSLGLINDRHFDPSAPSYLNPYLINLGEFGVGLRPEGVHVEVESRKPLIIRILDLLEDSELTAQALSTFVAVARPVARLSSPLVSFIDSVEGATNEMWNRIKQNKLVEQGEGSSRPVKPGTGTSV